MAEWLVGTGRPMSDWFDMTYQQRNAVAEAVNRANRAANRKR